jgi:hypothetical protein
VNEELKEEWQEYLSQTHHHEDILRDVFETMGLDPSKETPGRLVVRKIGETLVTAMQMAMREGGLGS